MIAALTHWPASNRTGGDSSPQGTQAAEGSEGQSEEHLRLCCERFKFIHAILQNDSLEYF